MSTWKIVTIVIAAALVVAAIVAAVVVYRDEISEFIQKVRTKFEERKNAALHPDEFVNYADVEI